MVDFPIFSIDKGALFPPILGTNSFTFSILKTPLINDSIKSLAYATIIFS
jgi:hypothetical protein